MDKKKKGQLFLYAALLVLFLAVSAFVTIKYAQSITKLINKPDEFRSLLLSYGSASVLVFIFFQVIQVIIAAIPGEFVQIAGGYVYGTVMGTLYSALGILLGSVIAFYISRFIGLPLLRILVPEKKLEKLSLLINSEKSGIIMFILFLIPGVPKDILVYAAGSTPINSVKFFMIFLAARFPALLGSSFIGANLHHRNYLSVVIISAISVVLFVLGMMYKEKIIEKLHTVFRHKQ